jgi:hypothetical protein
MNETPAPTFVRNRGFFAVTLLAAGIAVLVLSFAAGTPRARMNVMQVAAVTIFLVAALRSGRGRDSALRDASSSTFQGMRLTALAPALIAGTLAWAPMLPFDFISEDFEHVVAARQPMIPSLVDLTIRGQLGTFLRPVGFLSIFADHHLMGDSPWGYHLTNLLIHLLTAAALYCLCIYAKAPREMAGAAALIYAVLPSHVEAVAWMGARFDQLSACFGAWAVAFYVKSRNRSERGAFIACGVCLVLAVLSKENAFVLPLLMIAAEVFLLTPRRLKPALIMTALTAALFVYRWVILGGIGGYTDSSGHPIAFNYGIKTLEGLLIRGPALMLLGYNWRQPAGWGLVLIAGLTAGCMIAAAFCGKPGAGGRGRILFGFCWAVLTIAPAHSLLFIDASMSNSRVLHFGTVGMALSVGQMLQGIGSTRARQLSTAALALLLALGSLHNLAAWRWASNLTRSVLTDLRSLDPEPREGTRYVFHDLPNSVRGVYFLSSGLADAIRLSYGRDDLSGERVERPSSGEGPAVHIQWRGATAPTIERIAPQ